MPPILGPGRLILLLVGFEFTSQFGLLVKTYRVGSLVIDSVLVLWLLCSLSILMYLLSQYITAIRALSISLPLPASVHQDSVSQGARQVAGGWKPFVVLIVFCYGCTTLYHLETGESKTRILSIVKFSKILFILVFRGPSNMPGNMEFSIRWTVFGVLVILFLIGFVRFLLISEFEPDFENWGYFLYLYRIITFVLSIWRAVLWIVDYLEGRIEISRR